VAILILASIKAILSANITISFTDCMPTNPTAKLRIASPAVRVDNPSSRMCCAAVFALRPTSSTARAVPLSTCIVPSELALIRIVTF